MNLMKLFEKSEGKEFTTFPKTLDTYEGYKPVFIFIISAVISLILSMIILKFTGIPKDPIMNIIVTALTVITMIPSIYIATRIIYKIPFSTQIAPIRKWNWGIYFKSFIITLIVYAIFLVFDALITKKPVVNNLTIITFALCIILPLFQGFAEEYMCRGLLMQSFGSWIKIPIIAIILQATVFSALHGYNATGSISIICTGLCYGFLTWYGQGLEAASAMHALNNIYAFLLMGFGLQNGASDAGALGLFGEIAMVIIPVVIIIILDKKFNWGLETDVN
ncbi:CPBP family intramembrane glutamic endopeptidase [Methanobrevibacter sp.]|uniref:CPBP family intramembrane glutamic endopeptidase n=1 Tax=Methanobrevibacter sp. TaxID=66852 RepID=UPI0038692FB9